MFNKYSTYCISKYVFGPSFPPRQGQGFSLEIQNHSRHTFSQYSKESKKCQNGSSFVIPLNPIQARFFNRLKVQETVLGTPPPPPPMISGTIQASPMKCCTVTVLRRAYQNTRRNFQKSDL